LTYDTNIGGTVNVFEAVRSTPGVRVLINITSDKCYENREWIWGYRDNDPMGGHDPYSASKGCAELVFSSYPKSFFSENSNRNIQIGAASARASNVIGGGDWGTDRLIPDCIRAWRQNKSVDIRNPHAVRPWQHVLEPLSGYLWLGALLCSEPQNYSGGWNIGPDDASHLTVAEVVDKLIQYWGSRSWKNHPSPDAPHEAYLLKLNCDKAPAELNWHSVLEINDSLQVTAEWYKIFYESKFQEDMYTICINHILTYKETAKKNDLLSTNRKVLRCSK
jgi:CDP-glucose 4,6-dehydratase